MGKGTPTSAPCRNHCNSHQIRSRPRYRRGVAGAHRDGEVHLAPSLVQLLGDLGARLAGADHEHGTVGELPWPTVVERVRCWMWPGSRLDAAGIFGRWYGPVASTTLLAASHAR